MKEISVAHQDTKKTRLKTDKQTKPKVSAPCIVGIGASAGGYDAIKQFFHAMPSDSGLAFVIVQHLDPAHDSLAAEVFGKWTAMPVVDASDGMSVEANHVYTSPSDKEIAVHSGQLRLTARAEIQGQLHFPIDHFFHSLGEDCATRSIGVILSGNGSDGTLGLKTIVMHEGIVLVQSPATAAFDSMPRSAIAAHVANFVLPVEEMPRVICDYARLPYVSNAVEVVKETDTKSIQSLIEIVQTRRGYDFSGYKRNTLMRRVHRRMSLQGFSKLSNYVTFLKKNVSEVDALFKDLLIGVTDFFRDADAWKILTSEVIIPLVRAKKRDEPIRIWIPGCSTGEEAYTMAMVVLDRVRLARKVCPVQIFATDTNHDALEVARTGRYPGRIAHNISAARLKRYFDQSQEREDFIVSDELRSSVVFGVQNLFADPPFGRVDLISCRNVLIYLESELQKRVLNIFHFALKREGYLFLGSAESNGSRDDLFKPVSARWRIFQRVGVSNTTLLRLPSSTGESRIGSNLPSQRLSQGAQVAAIAQKLILERFVPASVLVNSEYEVLYFSGDTESFLTRPRGIPTQDLLSMAREGLRSRLRAMLREAAGSSFTVTANAVQMKKGKHFESVQIVVTPQNSTELGQLFLVVFRQEVQASTMPIGRGVKGVLVRQLEEELQATRDDLLDAVERFESITEDLKDSNEKIVLSNEELRSMNEELESSKEELQSLNEELSTVNLQLEAKLRELEISNGDLQNLLESSDIATICLDQSLRIKWFAPAAKKQFHFIASDIGRPISDLLSALNDKELMMGANAVLAKQLVSDHEFQADNGRWYIRRILPYRTEHARINGLILTYTDITDVHFAIELASVSKRDLVNSLERTDKLKAFSSALVAAEERERKSLAKYLHDDLGQVLAVLALKTVAIKKQKMPKLLKVMIDDSAKTIDQINAKMREIAFQLNPPMLDQLGMAAALQWMADEVRNIYHLDVEIEDDGSQKLVTASVSATVIRAVRELLLNVSKHAQIEKAIITLDKCDDGRLAIAVKDTGAGFDPTLEMQGDGLSLVNMKERINLLGGKLEIHSEIGEGTTAIIKVPMVTAEQATKSSRPNGKGK